MKGIILEDIEKEYDITRKKKGSSWMREMKYIDRSEKVPPEEGSLVVSGDTKYIVVDEDTQTGAVKVMVPGKGIKLIQR